MPSRPIFITPARSAHNPPRPAIKSGVANLRVAPEVPGEEISVAPVSSSTKDIIRNIPAMNKVMRAGDLKNTLALIANLFSLLLVLVDFILSP